MKKRRLHKRQTEETKRTEGSKKGRAKQTHRIIITFTRRKAGQVTKTGGKNKQTNNEPLLTINSPSINPSSRLTFEGA